MGYTALGLDRPNRRLRSLALYVPLLFSETALVTLASAGLLLALTLPAFGSYFIGEDFTYLGKYRAFGDNFLRAVFSPMDGIFFRPVFTAVDLIWQAVLPFEPLLYHLRNLGFTALNLALLYRVLVYLVPRRRARIMAVVFFAASKVHLTAIGYLSVYDSVMSLMLLLGTVLCFERYVVMRRRQDYVLGLVFCGLAIFTKDYGLVVVVVVVALVAFWALKPAEWAAQWRPWALRLAPLPSMALAYLAVRYAIVGPPPADNATYSPALSLDLAARKLGIFVMTLGNLSYGDSGTMGAPGIAGLAGRALQNAALLAWGDIAVAVLFFALLVGTLLLGRRAGWPLLIPLVWIAAYLGPTLLTRNIQMYYMYEPLAGAAVLLAMCLGHARRRWINLWTVALAVIVVNAAASNYTSVYHWQFAARAAGMIAGPVVQVYRGEPLRSVTFMAGSQPFWQYVLTADGKAPMVAELLKQPHLRVAVLHPAAVQGQVPTDGRDLLVDIDHGFTVVPPGTFLSAETPDSPAPMLNKLNPASTRAGVPFGVQADGSAALNVDCANALPGTTIVFDDTPLVTAYGTPQWLSAIVPRELFQQAGRHQIYLRSGEGRESNRLEFVVEP
ncbi:MAG TPA: hypothetical protein VII06_32215 [Chloroflexota bacterium]|jgi:hypothetical protein